jgi:uncharacterized protein
MSRMIYVNLPVRDLEKSKAFFTALGFSINPNFTDETAACVVIEANSIYVMLLTHKRFADFTPGPIADARSQTEVLTCLTCSSREEVDDLVRRAVAAGGNTYKEPIIHGGFMYGHGFQDPDGHVWEVVWMDPVALPQA